ncbi:MAG: hypothetical protein JXA13_15235 [Anaerolineales bacterium]|nr:hypothetical protein [Anaerolineales bacterium]
MKKTLLILGGSMTLLFALLHLSFWEMGNWAEELGKLAPLNSGILQMLTTGSIYMLVFAAMMTFYLSAKKEFAFSEKALLAFIAGYYLMRIAFAPAFFGYSTQELIIWIICLLTAVCYLIPIIRKQL